MRKRLTENAVLPIMVITVLTVIAMKILEPAYVQAACTLKTWSGGNVVLPTDLNTNFSCLNSNIKGSGFSLITSSDIVTSGPTAINHTNMVSPLLMPVAMWYGGTSACTQNGACSANVNYGATVTRTAQGTYTVTNSPARADSTYVALAASEDGISTCHANTYATGTFQVVCNATATNTATDAPFIVFVYDDE